MSLQSHIRRKFSTLFVTNYQLRQLVEKMLAAQPEVNTLKDGIACFIMAKSFKTHGVAVNLAKNGYSEDADMLIRTLFDGLLIIAACLKDETEETALKFMRFDDTIRAKMYKTLKDKPTYKELFEERLNNPKPENEPVEAFEARAQKWRQEYGSDYWQRWHSGNSTGQLAEQVEMAPYFQTAYSLQSQLTHSLPRSMNFYLKQQGKNIVMDTEPKERSVDMSLASAFNMLIVVADKFNDHFHLGNDDELKRLTGEWAAAVEEVTKEND